MSSTTTRSVLSSIVVMPLIWGAGAIAAVEHKEGRDFRPFVWPSEPPQDCPFEPSKDLVGIAFTGVHSDYHVADTWYPSWASDGNLYSPWTDGSAPRADGSRENSNSGTGKDARTDQAVLIGDDPLNSTRSCLRERRHSPKKKGPSRASGSGTDGARKRL